LPIDHYAIGPYVSGVRNSAFAEVSGFRRKDTDIVTWQTRVLIVEDDPNIVDLIRSNLAIRGFETLTSADGDEALHLLDSEQPDIVLLDLTLPEDDGLEVCRRMRERSTVAIIVVSARRGEQDKVTALRMGADDYLTKPFGINELIARILARLRRTRGTEPAAEATTSVITIGDLQIDLVGQAVLLDGAEVQLTPTEFALLRELATNRGRLMTPAQLLRSVWGRGYATETGYVRTYMCRLRTKLERPGSAPLFFSQPRAGYWITAD
jgi:two-component system KDP operon response regulator KdpE